MTDYANHWHSDAWESRVCADSEEPDYDDYYATDDTVCRYCGEWAAYCNCELEEDCEIEDEEVCDDDE